MFLANLYFIRRELFKEMLKIKEEENEQQKYTS